MKQEGKSRGAGVNLSTEPQKRGGEVEFPPSFYFGSKVQGAAALVLLRETGSVLVQHIEVERRQARGEGCEDEFTLFSASPAFACVKGFAS